jgi:hypothetical protein
MSKMAKTDGYLANQIYSWSTEKVTGKSAASGEHLSERFVNRLFTTGTRISD